MRRGHLAALAAWTAVWLLFFLPLLLQFQHIPGGDFSNQFHTFASFQAREMLAGHLPLWSPGSYAGIPFAADTQAAVFYLPRWLTVLLSAPWGFPYYALELEALAHIWLAGVFTYWLAYDITRRPAAGLVAALAFGLGGYLLSYPVQQLAILETVTWLPLVLYMLRRAILTPQPRLPLLAGAALLFGLILYAGHPQTFLHACYLTAAYFLFLVWQARWAWRWVLGLGVLFGTVAVGVSAAAWLPALQYAAETTRSAVGYDFVSSGFPLLDYLQTIVPGTLTLWSPQYVGLAAATLGLVAFFGRHHQLEDGGRPGSSQAEIVLWTVVALLAALLSLGDKGVLFEAAYRAAPGFSLFRQQERLVGLFSLSLALLAAQGLAISLQLAARNPAALRRLIRPAMLTMAGLLLAAGIVLAGARRPTDSWLAVWLGQWLILGLAAVALWTMPGRPRLLTATLLALLAIDLLLAVRPTMNLQPGPPSVFWPQPGWLTTLQADEPGRIDSQNQFLANIGELHGLEDIRGISPLKAAVVEGYESLPRPIRWQLLGVTHVIAPETIEPALEPLTPLDESLIPGQAVDAQLFRFPDALPRAWLAAELLVVADESAALAALADPGFDPARQVVLTEDAAAALAITSPGDPSRAAVSIERQSPGLRLSVETPEAAVLVISEWLRPGWRLRLDDGEQLALVPANAGLMAAVIPAGTRTLTLDYTPGLLWLALALSLATAAVAAAVAWRWRPAITYRTVLPSRRPVRDASPTETATAARRAHLLLLVIVLAGFGLRLFLLGHQELRGDEAFSYLFTRLPLGEVVGELIDQGDPHPPLHYLSLNAWTDLVGVSEVALRYLSALAGTLLLPALYLLGRQMLNRPAGLVAAGLAALSPGLIWLGQDVRNQYTFVMLFAALATLILVSMPPPAERTRRAALIWWGTYALAGVLTVYSHYYGVFALLAHGLYLAFTPDRRADWWRWIGSGTVVLLVLLPWLAPAFGRTLAAGQLSDPSQPELAAHLLAIGRDLLVGPALAGGPARWLFLGAVGVVVWAAVALARRRPGWAAMLLGWLVMGVLAIFLIRFSRSTFNAFYGSVVAPAWWLLLAAGLVLLWQQGRWRRAAAVTFTGLLAVAMTVSLTAIYTDPAHSRTIGYRTVAAHLAANAGPDDLLVGHFPDPVWDYYLRDLSIDRSLQPARPGQTPAETERALAGLAAAHDRLWFVPYRDSVWDPDNVAGRWLDYHTLTEAVERLDRHTLYAYRPLEATGAVMTPVGRQTDGAIELAAAYLTVDGRPVDLNQPAAIQPGSEIAVTLRWDALGPVAEESTVFVHLLNNDGSLAAQHDGIPAQGTRPTSTWQAGEQLLDRHVLTVPETFSGNGRLVAGLYDPVTLERRPFGDADAVTLVERVIWAGN